MTYSLLHPLTIQQELKVFVGVVICGIMGQCLLQYYGIVSPVILWDSTSCCIMGQHVLWYYGIVFPVVLWESVSCGKMGECVLWYYGIESPVVLWNSLSCCIMGECLLLYYGIVSPVALWDRVLYRKLCIPLAAPHLLSLSGSFTTTHPLYIHFLHRFITCLISGMELVHCYHELVVQVSCW